MRLMTAILLCLLSLISSSGTAIELDKCAIIHYTKFLVQFEANVARPMSNLH